MERFTGYIYTITGACGGVYIGSTLRPKQRLCEHLKTGKMMRSVKLLQSPLKMEVIDTRQYKLKKTLRLVEQFFIDNNECVNIQRAYTNRDGMIYKNLKKKDYLKNREHYRELKRKNYLENKEYYNEKNRQNYHKNKEIYNERRNVRVECECGCMIIKRRIAEHRKTMKHRNNLIAKEQREIRERVFKMRKNK